KIRSDILHSHKIKNAKEYINRICLLHIATPISSDDEPIEEPTITDLDYQVSDNEDGNNVEEGATSFSNVEKADIGSSNIEKAATRFSNVEKAAAEFSNIKEAATGSSNWTNQNLEDEDLVTEEEQQWENTINE
ncbi:18683_t:CDS:1, partial [Racocetra fulgida]